MANNEKILKEVLEELEKLQKRVGELEEKEFLRSEKEIAEKDEDEEEQLSAEEIQELIDEFRQMKRKLPGLELSNAKYEKEQNELLAELGILKDRLNSLLIFQTRAKKVIKKLVGDSQESLSNQEKSFLDTIINDGEDIAIIVPKKEELAEAKQIANSYLLDLERKVEKYRTLLQTDLSQEKRQKYQTKAQEFETKIEVVKQFLPNNIVN